jgi:4'-phosphopantetheinyl transferase
VLGLQPHELVFCVGRFGKPTLAGVNSWRVSFSFSRTYQVIALALATGVDIGVDVEGTLRGDGLARQSQIFCDSQEERALTTLTMAGRRERLIQTWTLKEALVKAKGVGLSMPLSTGLVSILVHWHSLVCTSPHSTVNLLPTGTSIRSG